jgi:hypothetical protein
MDQKNKISTKNFQLKNHLDFFLDEIREFINKKREGVKCLSTLWGLNTNKKFTMGRKLKKKSSKKFQFYYWRVIWWIDQSSAIQTTYFNFKY